MALSVTAGRSTTSIGDAETGALWAGGGGDWHGAGIWRSEDGGETWQVTKLTKGTMDDWAAKDPDFAKMIGWIDRSAALRLTNFRRSGHSATRMGGSIAGTKPASLLTRATTGASLGHGSKL